MTVAQLQQKLSALVAARAEVADFDFQIESPDHTHGCRGVSVAVDEPIVTALLEPFMVYGVLGATHPAS